jgi:hypothetical protein
MREPERVILFEQYEIVQMMSESDSCEFITLSEPLVLSVMKVQIRKGDS